MAYFEAQNLQEVGKPVNKGPEHSPIPYFATPSPLPEVVPPKPSGLSDEKIFVGDERNGFNCAGRRFAISRAKFILIAVIVLLVIIAAVVGGVVGALKNKDSSNASKESSNDESQAAQVPAAIRNNTGLAVTGWWYGEDEFSGRMFYQDNEGYLRMTSMESTNQGRWSAGTKFAKAKIGSPLAAASHNSSIYGEVNAPEMQTHVFYLDDNSQLREYVFSGNSNKGKAGDLNEKNIKVADDSQLGAYWPIIAFQNDDNSISEVRYNCSTPSADCWKETNLGIYGPGPSTPLSVAPMGINFKGAFIYYQKEDGDLVRYAWDASTGKWKYADLTQKLSNGRKISILAKVRNENDGILDHYALWQNGSGDLVVSWKDTEEGWNSPVTPEGFKGSFKNTSITCISAASWSDKELPVGKGLNRCFFIGGKGNLREVLLEGKTWKDNKFLVRVSQGIEE